MTVWDCLFNLYLSTQLIGRSEPVCSTRFKVQRKWVSPNVSVQGICPSISSQRMASNKLVKWMLPVSGSDTNHWVECNLFFQTLIARCVSRRHGVIVRMSWGNLYVSPSRNASCQGFWLKHLVDRHFPCNVVWCWYIQSRDKSSETRLRSRYLTDRTILLVKALCFYLMRKRARYSFDRKCFLTFLRDCMLSNIFTQQSCQSWVLPFRIMGILACARLLIKYP